MANILGVGIATLDIVNATKGFPEEDAEVRACSQRIQRGGNASNTLTVLSQLKQNCSFLGTLAEDNNAQLIRQSLQHYDIDYRHCPIIPDSSTPTSYITLNRLNGSRTIVHYRQLPELSYSHFQKMDLRPYDWIHFEARNIEQTQLMIKRCRDTNPNAVISVELEKNRDQLHLIYNLADIYFGSKAFAKTLGCESAEPFLLQLRRNNPQAILIAPWGEDGAYALQNHQLLHGPAQPPDTITDTIGAGDSFIAGFIHCHQQSQDIAASLEFANRIAGHKCGKSGFDLQLDAANIHCDTLT